MSEPENETPETPDEETAGTAVAEEAEAPFKMSLTVDIQNAGPCKKHVRVVIPRGDLDYFYNDRQKTALFAVSASTGHVPRKLVGVRGKEVGDQVRKKVLMQSLQQLGEDHKLDAINEPDLDVETLLLPDEGDFTYEFDTSVPSLRSAELRRARSSGPVRATTDADVRIYLEHYLTHPQLVPHDGAAEAG